MSAARRSTAADALARMQRAAAAPSPATRAADPDPALTTPNDDPAATTPTLTEPATRSTRTTLDLDRERYVALRAYAARHGAKGAEVLRALLDQLQRDPQLAQAIAHRLAHDRETLTLR